MLRFFCRTANRIWSASPLVLVASIAKPREKAPLDIRSVPSCIWKQRIHATSAWAWLQCSLHCKYLSPNNGLNGVASTNNSPQKTDILPIWSGRGRPESGARLALLIGTPFRSNYPSPNLLMPSLVLPAKYPSQWKDLTIPPAAPTRPPGLYLVNHQFCWLLKQFDLVDVSLPSLMQEDKAVWLRNPSRVLMCSLEWQMPSVPVHKNATSILVLQVLEHGKKITSRFLYSSLLEVTIQEVWISNA